MIGYRRTIDHHSGPYFGLIGLEILFSVRWQRPAIGTIEGVEVIISIATVLQRVIGVSDRERDGAYDGSHTPMMVEHPEGFLTHAANGKSAIMTENSRKSVKHLC